jgi:hypothetical protein
LRVYANKSPRLILREEVPPFDSFERDIVLFFSEPFSCRED